MRQAFIGIRQNGKAIAVIVGAMLIASAVAMLQPQTAQAEYGFPDSKPCTQTHVTPTGSAPCTGTMWLEPIEAPSCTAEGIGQYICDTCYYPEDPFTIPKLSHDYEELSRIEPTCTADGSRSLICSNCNDQTTETLPATGHSWGSWTTEKAASVSAPGVETRTCSVCGDTESRNIPQLASSSGGSYAASSSGSFISGSAGSADEDSGDEAEDAKDAAPAAKTEKKATESKKASPPADPGEKKSDAKALADEEGEGSGLPLKAAGLAGLLIVVLAGGLFLLVKPLIAGGSAGAAGAAAAGAVLGAEAAGAAGAATAGAVVGAGAVGAAGAATAAGAAAAAGGFLFSPNSNPKTVLLCTEEIDRYQSFIENMRAKSYLVVETVESSAVDSIVEDVKRIAPDLIVLHLDSPEGLEALRADMAAITAEYGRSAFGVIAEDCLAGSQDEGAAATLKAELDALQEAGEIVSYAFDSACDDDKLLRLVLPVYGPRAKANEMLDAVAVVSLAMGVPVAAAIINAVQNGGEVQRILKKHKTSANDAVTIFADITEVLGFNILGYTAQTIDDSTRAAAKSDAEGGTGTVRTKVKVLADLVYVLGSLA